MWSQGGGKGRVLVGGGAGVEGGGQGWRGRSWEVVVMVVVVPVRPFLPPSAFAVLAASRAARPVAALLAAAVAALAGQWRGRGLALGLLLLQDGRRAQRLAQQLGWLVVARGRRVGRGDFADLAAAAAQAGRGSDAHDGAEGGDGDFVLEGARVPLRPVVTLGAGQGAVRRCQSRWLVVFVFLLFLLLFFIVIFVLLLFLLFFFLLLLNHRSPPPLLALLGAVLVTSSVMISLQAGRRGELVEVLRGREGAYEEGAQNTAEVLAQQIWPTMQLF